MLGIDKLFSRSRRIPSGKETKTGYMVKFYHLSKETLTVSPPESAHLIQDHQKEYQVISNRHIAERIKIYPISWQL